MNSGQRDLVHLHSFLGEEGPLRDPKTASEVVLEKSKSESRTSVLVKNPVKTFSFSFSSMLVQRNGTSYGELKNNLLTKPLVFL